MKASAPRVTSELAALYDFRLGGGTTVPDSSSLENPAIVVRDAGAVTWQDDGLRVDRPTRLESVGRATPLRDALVSSDAVTVEAWATPANLRQGGPARLVSLASSREENVMVGQGNHTGGTTSIESRTNSPGRYMSRLQSGDRSLSAAGTHVVYVKAPGGKTSVYLNGQKMATATDGHAFTNLHPSFGLTLANQADGSRPWLGTLHLVAVYSKALSDSEVAQNFAAGIDQAAEPTPGPEPVPTPEDAVAFRVGRGLEAFSDFSRGSGSRLSDSSGQPGGLDLVLADPGSTRWDEGGWTLLRPTVVASEAPVTTIRDALAVTNQLTVEAWVTTASVDSAAGYMSRVETADRSFTTRQTQVVSVYAANGEGTTYLHGKKAADGTTNHRVKAWPSSSTLFLGNRPDGQRPWLDTVHSRAISAQALTAREVAQNFEAGTTGTAEVQPEPLLLGPEPGPQPAPPPDPVAAAPGQAEGDARSLSRHGITWTFDREYPYGTYANGDYWVRGPVKIIGIAPGTRESDGWNGSMVNPPTAGKLGYGGHAGLDYSSDLNLGLASPSKPKMVTGGSSIVSTVGRARQGDSDSEIEVAAVLTVIDTAPPARSFRPPYVGTDKEPRGSADDLDLSRLPRLPRVQEAPYPTSFAPDFERVWLDHVEGWYGRRLHPRAAMPDYGRDLANEINRASLVLMLDYEDHEKMPLLVNLIQIGIDLHGIVEGGGTRHWTANGGHGSGRKWPILFAGHLLNDRAMMDIGQRKDVAFGEDEQTFFVAVIAGKPNGGFGGYGSEHLGMPEWRFGNTPDSADVRWDLAYRHCCTTAAWGGAVLSARLLGLVDEWNHPALFAYQDRYVATETQNQFWDPFTEQMWMAYRHHGVAPRQVAGYF